MQASASRTWAQARQGLSPRQLRLGAGQHEPARSCLSYRFRTRSQRLNPPAGCSCALALSAYFPQARRHVRQSRGTDTAAFRLGRSKAGLLSYPAGGPRPPAFLVANARAAGAIGRPAVFFPCRFSCRCPTAFGWGVDFSATFLVYAVIEQLLIS